MPRRGQGSNSKPVAGDRLSDEHRGCTRRREGPGRYSRQVATVDVDPAARQDNKRTCRADRNHSKQGGGQHAQHRQGRGRSSGPKRRHSSRGRRRRTSERWSSSSTSRTCQTLDSSSEDLYNNPPTCGTCRDRRANGDVLKSPSCDVCFMALLKKKPNAP